eukprot:gnl/TRDRNA2_/TRDRNA2_140798_c0_seq2.p1 gnl/TRDRNA2_/TRDRNA2_140798_c0~~gnl/TRDRNA2_/TRDRNA2_140798_c0_seq2.p1  ORF type:complete len:296 (+),score=21.91 gnl/TRDRNA2_/TRDRNA2_140798_c0_seq2:121-888(+)
MPAENYSFVHDDYGKLTVNVSVFREFKQSKASMAASYYEQLNHVQKFRFLKYMLKDPAIRDYPEARANKTWNCPANYSAEPNPERCEKCSPGKMNLAGPDGIVKRRYCTFVPCGNLPEPWGAPDDNQTINLKEWRMKKHSDRGFMPGSVRTIECKRFCARLYAYLFGGVDSPPGGPGIESTGSRSNVEHAFTCSVVPQGDPTWLPPVTVKDSCPIGWPMSFTEAFIKRYLSALATPCEQLDRFADALTNYAGWEQ